MRKWDESGARGQKVERNTIAVAPGDVLRQILFLTGGDHSVHGQIQSYHRPQGPAEHSVEIPGSSGR